MKGIQPVDGLRLQTATGESAVTKGRKIVTIRIGDGEFKYEVLVADYRIGDTNTSGTKKTSCQENMQIAGSSKRQQELISQVV